MGQYLLSSGADVNRADAQGRRPLHSAATNGLTSVLQYAHPAVSLAYYLPLP
jgi:ankyrin repeat protein